MNIYKYTFYVSYKFGVKIKTPNPAFAAVCVATAVKFIHLAFFVGFLYSFGLFPALKIFFDNSILGKLLALLVGYIMLAINTRYVFGIKDANYQGFIDGFDRDSSKGKKQKTLATLFFVIILSILGLVVLWYVYKG